MTVDLSQFAIGGATRPDSFTGLDPAFLQSLQAMIAAAPPEIQQNLKILSGFRSPERQAQLWEEALQKYGSPEKARKWVAPPGRSFHNKGQAVDLRYVNDAARAWAHENAKNFGLHFPLSNEPWHIEPIGARGGGVGSRAVAGGAGRGGPQASGTPAPALGLGIDVGGADVRAFRSAEPVAAVREPGQGGLGAVFEALAPNAPTTVAPPMVQQAAGPEPMGDPMAATIAAMQGAEKSRGLRSALMPDLEALMGLGKRVG